MLNAGKVTLDHRWNYKDVFSTFARLYLITEGQAYIYHHGREFELRPGFLYLIPSYTYSSYHCDLSHTQFYLSFLEETQGVSIFDTLRFQFETQHTPLDQLLLDRLLELNPNRTLTNDDPKYYDNDVMTRQFKQENELLPSAHVVETSGILNILLSRFITADQIHADQSSHNVRIVKHAIRYINQNLHHTLTVNILAEYSNLSVDHFSRIFQKVTQTKPVQFIQARRIERAQVLLSTTQDKLETIAEKVGLTNLGYFARLFKKMTGRTPGEHRRGL